MSQRTPAAMKRKMPFTPKKKLSQKAVARKAHDQGIVRKGDTRVAILNRYGPFPATRNYTFMYENGAVVHTPGTATSQIGLNCNSLFDIDSNASGPFGNHLPTDFAKLLSSTGPYRDYKVNSWDIEITIVNQTASPVAGWIVGASSSFSDWDTFNECGLFPSAEPFYMTGVAGAKGIITVKSTGHIKNVFNYTEDAGFSGSYSSNATNNVYGGLYLYTTDGTNLNVSLAIRFRSRAKLSNGDGN